MRKLPSHLSLEIPRFGEFARQHAVVSTQDIDDCLSFQRSHGGRLGQILVQRQLLDADCVAGILRSQARWAARMRSHDVAPKRFPLSVPLSLCLPCYNEAAVIGDVLSGACTVLPEFVEEFEIVVVDDGSSDDTAAIVRRAAALDDRIRLIRHEVNRGYGAAVASGLRAADGELICFTDGDGQFNLLDLPQLLSEVHRADVVVGYRHNRADHRLRSINSNAWKLLIRFMLGVRVRDLDCAFKLFPRFAVDAMQLNSAGACISAEIMTQCVRAGLDICEVPINHYPRSAGKATGANLRVIVKAFRELPTLWKYRKMPAWNGVVPGQPVLHGHFGIATTNSAPELQETPERNRRASDNWQMQLNGRAHKNGSA